MVSVVVHSVIIFLLIVPFFMPRNVIERLQQGAGGPGPAGGGGGGSRGTGGETREKIRFVRVSPTPVPTPTTLPPIVPPPPKVTPKVEPPKPVPVQPPVVPKPQVGGTGRTGAAGRWSPRRSPERAAAAAPTDRPARVLEAVAASVQGSGRGGGVAPVPARGAATRRTILPFQSSSSSRRFQRRANVRGFHFVAEFDVDSTGRVITFDFTPTRDGDYNKRIAQVLRSMKFRPGTRPDGSPLRMKAQVGYEF